MIARRTGWIPVAIAMILAFAAIRCQAADVACATVERIRVHVGAEPIPVGAEHVGVQVSIGVAQYRNGESAAALLDRADQSLYTAKKNGRNRVVSAASTT